MTRIEEMARWAASLDYDKIPDAVKDRAKMQILSVVASAHAGGISPASKKLLAAVRSWDGGGRIPVVTTGENLSLHGALFANTSLCMAHDYDDYLFLGHTGHSAVFASLLVALEAGKTVRDVITAQVAANEIGGRMGAACLIGPQNGQVWTFIHLLEAAVAASKLYGLDAKKTAHAIAISLYQPNFALFPGFMGPDTKILSASQTSLGGLMAAQLAREGFTGALDIIENRQGFLNQFSYAPLEFMLSGYGKSWVTQSIAYKLVPGCAYIDTAVDAMAMILEQYKEKAGKELGPRDVREIEVKASMLTTEMNHLSASRVGQGELNPIAINFSIAANLAIMVLTGGLKVDNLDPDWLELHKEDILTLCRRTTLSHDWAMSLGVTGAFRKVLDLGKIVDYVGLGKLIAARRKAAKHFGGGVNLGLKDLAEMRKSAGEEGRDYMRKMAGGVWKNILGPKRRIGTGGPPDLAGSDFGKFTMPFAARVTLKTTDWKEFSAQQDIPWGAPGKPWEDTARRVREKFRREGRRNLTDAQVEWVLENTDTLENVISVEKLVENIVHNPRAPKSERKTRTEVKDIRSAPKKDKTPPPRAMDEDDLPPIIFEPVVKSPPRSREKPQRPPKREREERAPEKKEEKKVAAKKTGVTMRKVKPGEKQPRPPKGAPRKRSRRP